MNRDPLPHDRQVPAVGPTDRLEPGRRPVASGSAAVVSHPCREQDHGGCRGKAWDHAIGEFVACECSCH